jgi:hypothetical protein
MSDATVKVKLIKPIENGEDQITELEFKEPNGKMISSIGYPLVFIGSDAQPLAKIVSIYISRLAGVPPHVVDKLCAADYSACMGVVLGFFGQ